ncbi:protein YaaA [Porphyridium purpureum]|uniref:Protein YaaA n=1 Tax=Porphyridium purpureum TaxID=35688 RepID=A0A5J4YPX4_PORPP|nr:protein YaaA [Porphyridium purpureum]|eukprot:POR8125..scf222_8
MARTMASAFGVCGVTDVSLVAAPTRPAQASVCARPCERAAPVRSRHCGARRGVICLAVGFQKPTPSDAEDDKPVMFVSASKNVGETTIQLGKFLKTQGVYETGGQTKTAIQNGEVLVNGQVELRRGRRLRNGDTIEAAGLTIDVQFEVTQQADEDIE